MNVDMIYHISCIVFLECLFPTRYSHLTCLLYCVLLRRTHWLEQASLFLLCLQSIVYSPSFIITVMVIPNNFITLALFMFLDFLHKQESVQDPSVACITKFIQSTLCKRCSFPLM